MPYKINPVTGELDYYEASAGSGSVDSVTFINANLTAGVYTYTHGLASARVAITVRNNSGVIVEPDLVTRSDNNIELINISSYGVIAGTWWVGAIALT